MALKDALQFISRVRSDDQVSNGLRRLGIDPDLGECVAMGARMGLHFSVEELRTAFGYEWTMRSIHFGFQKKADS